MFEKMQGLIELSQLFVAETLTDSSAKLGENTILSLFSLNNFSFEKSYLALIDRGGFDIFTA